MRTLVTLLSSFIIILFSNCASSQFDKNPSFTVEKAHYQDFIGGKPESNRTMVTIQFAQKVENNIQFDSIFYNDKSTKLSIDSLDEKTIISGSFKTSNFEDKLIIIDKDPKKEFGNEAPIGVQKSPFELSKNECVISYFINNKKLYHKLNTLKKGKTIIYP